MISELAYAYASKPCDGEIVCGDQHVVVETQEGSLFALADGLGHGSAAAAAAQAFCAFVHEHPSLDLDRLIGDASNALSGTRGAAVALVHVSDRTGRLSFSGIGNVELQAVSREPIRPVSLPGIVGRRVRKTRRFDYQAHAGDFFVMYSDGISSRFDARPYRELPVQVAADRILQSHRKPVDDATCIVFRL